ncbi:A-kinase anchor protein 17B-like [Eublepharis macularius]|uniref:A-kinase anchor protein 17B-like n=1 Tax=Eublepharis macularius TaxID=481883 RepID=A0AA97KCA2_EUBMA|nr:A-kinase anchor protein 17B-like [Eublepharis macularius]XP_054852339.1 A-kinase anchor protein 17B-like [Eublepharis macularius]
MTVTLVCDPSEAMELCASQQLYLKPVAKLTISVVLPEHTRSTRAFSKWEVMDKLKNMICPDQFTSVKVSKSTKGFIRFEGEAETKRLVCSLKEKLHGKMIKLNGFKDDLQVVATEASPDIPTLQESEAILNDRELMAEDLAEQNCDVPNCIHLEGLPCKWFALRGSDSETPSEDILRAVFESFGKIKNVDIPMLDPYREEMVGGNVNNFIFRGLRTFDAYVQYQESTAFAKAMETLKGMKLMFKGDDGKALACNIKVTSDTTNHFSESAINQRNLERLTLQGLERERKREENRGKRGNERKRRDDGGDEKKVGEGKRKSKIKRREKRQIDRDEKRPRKQQKVTAEEELWPENMPEWEERKYLLAQRRVESIRLLTVLLNQIKDFVLSSRQIGEPLLESGNEREDCFPAPKLQNAQKRKSGSHRLRCKEVKDERESLHQLDQLNNTSNEEEEQYIAVGLPASPCHLVRTILNEPAARAVSSKCLTDKAPDCYQDCGLLQVTVSQDCRVKKSPDREDCPNLNLGCFPRVPRAGNCKKQKVYETEEFIHYLLNYYQTPQYARICPVTQNTGTESWWQRVVSHNGNGFQVSLKNKDGQCFTEMSFVPDVHERDFQEADSYKWEVIDEESEPIEVFHKGQACTREFTNQCLVWCGDSLGEISHRVPCDELNNPYLVSTSTNCDNRSQEENTGMKVLPPLKPFGHVYKLKDLLEEISSDSEYFSETFSESQSKMERRNGGCKSTCKSWPLSRGRTRELLICVQNGDCSKRSFCANSDCCDLAKRPKQRVKTTFKRSSSKLRHEGQKFKWLSSEEEQEASRKKKRKKRRSSGNSLHDESHYLEANHCGELESLSKIQRKCSKIFHHKMKCKAFHAMTEEVKAKDVVHLDASLLREPHQEAGNLLLRREVEADSDEWPLFPVEIIQTNPYPDSFCGAELGGEC